MSRRPRLERVVRELASFERSSASEGERRAADWIAAELREAGCRDVRIDEERAHGGYWWPLGLLNAGSWLASVLGGRRAAALAGSVAASAIYDDVSGGRLWFRRATLPTRPTWNVVAEAGDPEAERTIVFVSHHDAAHSGLVFHPALPRTSMKLMPRLHERAEQSVPILYGTFLGPVLLALWGLLGIRALRAAGTVLTLGAAAAMANIGASRIVPGANDNLSAVAVVLALARSLGEQPPQGVRVLLVSTGSEESFMEGMQAFAKWHFGALDPEKTEFVCIECVGSPELCVVEGEGMLRMRYYTGETRERLARAGLDAGVELTRGLRTVAATDALIALRAGYPTCLLGGVNETKFPSNYHWPSDTPDNLDWDSVEGALEVCEEFVRGRVSARAA